MSDANSDPASTESQAQDLEKPRGAGPTGLYTHGFWDKSLAPLRKAYFIGMARVVLLVSLLIWAVVTIYWGSLWKSSEKAANINAWILNRDQGGAIGTNISYAFMASNNNHGPHLTWSSIDPSRYPTSADVEKAVAVDQAAWVVLDILPNATAALNDARNSADASWMPTEVVQVYYSEARNQQAIDGLVMGVVRGMSAPIIQEVNAASLAQWLATNSANATLLANVARNAPQTLANGISLSYINLRPWNEPVSIAPTFVGLIYAMILAFNITMGNFGMRQGIQRQLKFSSFVMMRILVPLTAYLIVSCMFSLINVPFKLGFGGLGLGYGAGFMIWWMFTFMGMAVLGLWTEAALALVGPPFIGFALVFIIIINVAVANLPFELQVGLFKYGYAMPFYNLRQAYVAIIYNTGRHTDLLKYMGVLLAWIVVFFLTLPIWFWLERRRERKAAATSAGGPPNN